MADRHNAACFFFIDDSNLWMEAQNAAAAGNTRLPRLMNSDREPCLNIDIGKMIKNLTKDRTQGPLSLYVSRHPHKISAWDVFQPDIFKRTAMPTKIVTTATRLDAMGQYDAAIKKQKVEAIFIIVADGRNMLSSITNVLESGIRVELWAWKSNMATSCKQLRASYPSLLSLHFLDGEAS